MADNKEEIKKHLKLYAFVGLILILGTIITVVVAKFVDLGHEGVDSMDISFGLAIATIKASFVAVVFMHLKWEKRLIYQIMTITIIFFIALYLITWFSYLDPIK